MIISLLVAMDRQRGIGFQNRLPWRLSADLKNFKALTWGHAILMGRKTYDSIGKILPGRTNIIISRNPAFTVEGGMVVASLQQALEAARQQGETEAFVIGGAQIFLAALPLAQRIYLTQVEAEVEADVYFPELHWDDWQEKVSVYHPADEKNEHAFYYRILDRIAPPPSG